MGRSRSVWVGVRRSGSEWVGASFDDTHNYTFISSNIAAKIRHGGMSLFFQNHLELKKVRDDLSFDESVVICS